MVVLFVKRWLVAKKDRKFLLFCAAKCERSRCVSGWWPARFV